MKINIQGLKADINKTSELIINIKKRLREPMQPNKLPGDQMGLVVLKTKATLLCSMRAHTRHRIHMIPRAELLERQEKFIGTALDSYMLPDDPPETETKDAPVTTSVATAATA